MAVVLLILFIAILIIGTPIGVAMGFITIGSFWTTGGNLISIPQKMFSGIDNFTYLSIPLFIMASEIMSQCGLTRSLSEMCDTLVGRIKGGLAQTNVLGSMVFAGVSGSATADATGLGRIEIEMMHEAGFTKEYAASVTAASAIIGPIIPPSNIMIMYAVAASNVSVASMFMGGVLPGILLGLVEMAMCYFIAVKENHPRRDRMATPMEMIKAIWKGLPVIGLMAIIMGGITLGIFTATEASAVAVFYALIVAGCRKALHWKNFYKCCVNTAKTTANVMIIIAIASAMGWAITVMRVPQMMVEFCMTYINNKYAFLLFCNVLLLFLGCILDQAPALLLMTPILLPIALKFGIDPVHFGILMCFNLTIGLITPPVGMTLFVTANVAEIKLSNLFKKIMPFVFVGLIALMLITFVPGLSTWLPNLVAGK